jgi:hypothetical protein
MLRPVLTLLLSTTCVAAYAGNCSVAGTAYDTSGKPLQNAVVRLVDEQTHQASFSATGADAAFQFSALDGQAYRLDMLGPEIKVTGSHIPTRSVMGMTSQFTCRSGARQDVHAAG